MLLDKLLPDIQPQSCMVGDIAPAEPGFMGQPEVDISNENFCQLTSFPNPATVQQGTDVVLPILMQHSHPWPSCWAVDMNVCHMNARGRQQELSPEWHHGLHKLGHAKPFGYRQHREQHLPMLGPPFYSCQYFHCIQKGTSAKHQQGFDRQITFGEGAGNELGAPTNVLMGVPRYLLLQHCIGWVTLGAWCCFAGTQLVSGPKLLIASTGSLAVTARLASFTQCMVWQLCQAHFPPCLTFTACLALTVQPALALGLLALTSTSLPSFFTPPGSWMATFPFFGSVFLHSW